MIKITTHIRAVLKRVRETAPSRLCQCTTDLGRLLGSGDEEAEVDGVDVAEAVADELADERPGTMYRWAGPAAVGEGVVFVVDVVETSVVTESAARRERAVSVS